MPSDGLAIALLRRYERTGALADVDEAIEVARQALAQIPEGHPDRAARLSLLGYALSSRYERTGMAADLDMAIDFGRQAVAAGPRGAEDSANVANDLGNALMDRYQRTGAVQDLDEAVGRFGQAVALTPATHLSYPLLLSNLAAGWLRMYEHSMSAADLDEAILAALKAVEATPAGYPDLAMRLSNLALIEIRQSQRTSSRAYLDAAISDYRKAAELRTAPAHIRAKAARDWGAAAGVGEDWTAAVAGFTAAVTLLSRVASRDLTRADQEFWLSGFAGIGLEAAAYCLEAGRPEPAVELWEQGRGVLLGQALDLRTDVTRLAEQQPQLAADFTHLRDELDVARQTGMAGTVPPGGARAEPPGGAGTEPPESDGTGVGRGNSATHDAMIERRRELADNFDDLIERIRSQPGFGRFLLPPSYADVARLASSGPLVLINVNYGRSDALLITPGNLDVVSLPELTPQTVHDQVTSLFPALDDADNPSDGPSGHPPDEERLARILEWLWDAVTGPVLTRLGISGPPPRDGDWPRLWWCPAGPLAFLPLHAAGYHDTRFDSSPRTVLDRVISSYTPTMRALSYARRPSAGASVNPGATVGPGERRVLVVAMPHTPGAPDLPGAAQETALLRGLFGDLATIADTATTATHNGVLAALPQCTWTHFACHGISYAADPSASQLLLHDYRQKPLTVLDIARLHLDDAQLAYLSACSTALTGAALPDEAIHLASAFQLAGYRNVIATLWPIADRSATRIAANVYNALAGDATAGSAATALHHAIRGMRAIFPARPAMWAAFTHHGA